MYTTIITLYKQNRSQREISRTTGTNRRTVRKIIREYESSGQESPVPYTRASEVVDWHESIVNLLEKKLTRVRVYEELQAQGFPLSYSSLSRYIRKHELKSTTCIRFHTLPGEEGQVDFGDIGQQIDPHGKKRKAYVFSMRLSYSRLDYYEVVFDQSCETWIRCHINAFERFGGVPEVIKLDNLKAGVILPNFYEPVFQKEYKRMADHYGCLLAPCRVYQPQEKGKVESGIKYVKNNFFAGRTFYHFEDLCRQLECWQERISHRIHGTTKRKPSEVFASEEKSQLKPLPLRPFEMASWHVRKVQKDCHIVLEHNYYSVPSRYAHEDVTVMMNAHLIKVYAANNEVIAVHARSKKQGVHVTNPAHYAKSKRYCPGFKEYEERCQEQMQAIGNHSAELLIDLKKKRPKDWYRTARGVIGLRHDYQDEQIDKACQRALLFGLISYSKIRSILESGCYDLPTLPSQGGPHASFS